MYKPILNLIYLIYYTVSVVLLTLVAVRYFEHAVVWSAGLKALAWATVGLVIFIGLIIWTKMTHTDSHDVLNVDDSWKSDDFESADWWKLGGMPPSSFDK